MKITPAKDYKKPLYAIGVTAALMAVSVTGCTDFGKGGNVDLAGAADVRTDETTYCKKDADNEPVLAGEVVLDGELAPDDGVELEGEVSVNDTYETTLKLDGGAPIDET